MAGSGPRLSNARLSYEFERAGSGASHGRRGAREFDQIARAETETPTGGSARNREAQSLFGMATTRTWPACNRSGLVGPLAAQLSAERA